MTDAASVLATLRRPRLLIRAARLGIADYNRERDLKRLMHCMRTPSPSAALEALVEQESHLEESRKAGAAAYSATRHVDILIALMAEARLLPRPAVRPV